MADVKQKVVTVKIKILNSPEKFIEFLTQSLFTVNQGMAEDALSFNSLYN
jgi:hypothetical protein